MLKGKFLTVMLTEIRSLFVFALLLLIMGGCENSSSDVAAGQGGSMARFAIQDQHLYVANNKTIEVFSINGDSFTKVGEVAVGLGLETIFARGEYLYLGANDAMYIYSIAEPTTPVFVFRYSHIASCDPVVVQGTRAYVTLRAGSICNRGINALEILDISDPYNPRLISNYPMTSPHGLAVSGDYLFLCEGEAGLKVFDISDETNIKQLTSRNDFFAFDVIAAQHKITVTGEDGIFQFAYPQEGEFLKFLSKIPVERDQL